MLVLGVDVGYRNFGWCLVKVNGKPEVIEHHTADVGNTTKWRELLGVALSPFAGIPKPDVVSIEELVWYGKRKGVLALSHLAGAVAGYALGVWGAKPLFFNPREVKAVSRAHAAPEGFTEHEHDALSLCRLALGKEDGKGKNGKLAAKKPAARRT
jgi:Holliday junction resolvasome RuvABC endonuclease subunit